jgi:hypothetical protein
LKYKYIHLVVGLIFGNIAFTQTIIDTEASLKKIDSTFHIFGNFLGDQKTGNFNLAFIKADVTIGSRVNDDLFRLTYSHSANEFNGNLFEKSTNFQFRWNKIMNEKHSLFLFFQTGQSLRAFIDQRTLMGVGIRQHLYKKDSNYFDVAVGPFYEYEAYPAYNYEDVVYAESDQVTTRVSFNIFASMKIMDNISTATTLYTQWKYTEMRDHRIFGNQYIRFKINENVTTFIRYVVRYRSINYIKPLKNDTDFMYGLEINI